MALLKLYCRTIGRSSKLATFHFFPFETNDTALLIARGRKVLENESIKFYGIIIICTTVPRNLKLFYFFKFWPLPFWETILFMAQRTLNSKLLCNYHAV